MSEQQIPTRAKIVIIGGGVGGTSVAYHLAQLGETDVVLVDRNDLTSGSTFTQQVWSANYALIQL